MRTCVAPSHKRNLLVTIFDDLMHAKLKTQIHQHSYPFPSKNPAEMLLDFSKSSNHQINGFSQIPLFLTPLQFIGIFLTAKMNYT